MVLVLFNASPLDISWAKNSEQVVSIIKMFYPAQVRTRMGHSLHSCDVGHILTSVCVLTDYRRCFEQGAHWRIQPCRKTSQHLARDSGPGGCVVRVWRLIMFLSLTPTPPNTLRWIKCEISNICLLFVFALLRGKLAGKVSTVMLRYWPCFLLLLETIS